MLPIIEQRFFYQFIQGQLGRDNYFFKIWALLGHLAVYFLIIRTWYGDLPKKKENSKIEPYLLIYAPQALFVLYYCYVFNRFGYINSLMVNQGIHLMICVLLAMLYFSKWLNAVLDISWFIKGKNTFDCILYSFNANNTLHC